LRFEIRERGSGAEIARVVVMVGTNPCSELEDFSPESRISNLESREVGARVFSDLREFSLESEISNLGSRAIGANACRELQEFPPESRTSNLESREVKSSTAHTQEIPRG